jgi:hypothetical protein
MFSRLLALLFVATYVSVVSGFSVGTNVVQDIVSFGDIKEVLTRDNEAFLILLGDSLDLNSMRLRLLADEVAGELHGFTTVAFLDVRAPDVDFILSSWNVQAIPSWRLLPSARQARSNSLGAVKTPMEYTESTMTVDALKRFALQAVPPGKGFIDRIEKDTDFPTLHAAVAKAGMNVTFLITDKDKGPSLLYRRLAHKYAQRIGFADVVAPKCPKLSKALLDIDKNSELPVIVVYNPATKQLSRYKGGALHVNAISDWLAQFGMDDETYQQARTQAKEAIIRKLSKA